MNNARERNMELCLCRRCLEGFFRTQKYRIRRADPIEVIREPCMLCQVGYGYDIVIDPSVVAKNATTAIRRDSYVVDRAV